MILYNYSVNYSVYKSNIYSSLFDLICFPVNSEAEKRAEKDHYVYYPKLLLDLPENIHVSYLLYISEY